METVEKKHNHILFTVYSTLTKSVSQKTTLRRFFSSTLKNIDFIGLTLSYCKA